MRRTKNPSNHQLKPALLTYRGLYHVREGLFLSRPVIVASQNGTEMHGPPPFSQDCESCAWTSLTPTESSMWRCRWKEAIPQPLWELDCCSSICLSWLDAAAEPTAQTEQFERCRRSGRTLYCGLKHGLSAWVTQSLLLTKMKQYNFLVCAGAAFVMKINTNEFFAERMNGDALLCGGGQCFNHFHINEQTHMIMGGNNMEPGQHLRQHTQSERVCLSIWIRYWNRNELSVQPLLWAPAMLWALKSD